MQEPECCKRCELNMLRNPVALRCVYGKVCAVFGDHFTRSTDGKCGIAGKAGVYDEGFDIEGAAAKLLQRM